MTDPEIHGNRNMLGKITWHLFQGVKAGMGRTDVKLCKWGGGIIFIFPLTVTVHEKVYKL